MNKTGLIIIAILTFVGLSAASQPVSADTTAPTISGVTTTAANGTYATDAEIPLTVNFSEDIYSVGDITLTLNASSTAVCVIAEISSASSTSAAVCVYTVSAGDSTSDLNVSAVAGTIADLADNLLVNFTPGVNLASLHEIVIATAPPPTAPTILSVSSSAADGFYGIGANLTLTTTFSEAVYSSGDITLNLNANPTATCVLTIASTTPAATADCVYTVAAADFSNDLNVESVSGDIFNAGGEAMTNFKIGNKLASQKNIILDGTIPVLAGITTTKANGAYTVGEEIELTLNFSEAVVTTGTTTVSLNASSTAACLIAETAIATSSLPCLYTVAAGENTADLNVASVSGNVYDRANNQAAAPNPADDFATAYDIVIDTNAPTAALTNLPAAATTAATANITVGGDDVWYYRYSLNGANFTAGTTTPTSTPITLSGLPATSHSLRVIAGDLAGNWQATASATTFGWTVTLPPAAPGGGGGGGGQLPPRPVPVVLGIKINSYATGRMVKTAASNAVYHLVNDNTRHLYVNEVTYWSWHSGSWAEQGIETISQVEFDGLIVGEHVTVKPGSKLIRFYNSPRTYEVSDGGVIHYLSPAVAAKLYGASWGDKVIMIQNGFENNYSRGADMSVTATY